MTKGNDSRNRVAKWIRWIARIWSFPIIVDDNNHPWSIIPGVLVAIKKEGNP